MNTLSNQPGVKNSRKVDHFRFLLPLKVGPASLRDAEQKTAVHRAELLMRAITWCGVHRIRGNKNRAALVSDLEKKGTPKSTIERAMSIARCGPTRHVGHALIIQLYYSNADQDAFFDVRSWQHGTNLDDGIHTVKQIATDLQLDGHYVSHFCTVPYQSPTERRTLVGHFGGAVLVTASRHEFLTTHRLVEKLTADEVSRKAHMKAITDMIGKPISRDDALAGQY